MYVFVLLLGVKENLENTFLILHIGSEMLIVYSENTFEIKASLYLPRINKLSF